MQPLSAAAATDSSLFRIFLRNGKSIVSFGEFTHLDDEVVFAMPVGGPADAPRLHVVSLPASAIDWARTDRYSLAVRYQKYADTRGEDDFQLISADIARVLNDVALSKDKQAALRSAEQARQTLADWPAAHYGYRERDVREVVSLLDEAISELRAQAGLSNFAVALVAATPLPEFEPLLPAPTPREAIDQTLTAAQLSGHVSDRLALLQEVLSLLSEAGSSIPSSDGNQIRRRVVDEIQFEHTIDRRYQAVVHRLFDSATKAAAEARIGDVERVLNKVPKEDARLGGRRPEVVQALNASIQLALEDARHLRLLRDQWAVRRSEYRVYQRTVGSDLLKLVKMQPALEAIRRLDGPSPLELQGLRARLDGGADRLLRLQVPDYVRATHELLVSAWRFAETAVDARYDAVSSGNVSVAWQASSSAAGALLMVTRVQQDIRALLEPPRLP
jgi:hypothetical protein